jgi:hypothetical protein
MTGSASLTIVALQQWPDLLIVALQSRWGLYAPSSDDTALSTPIRSARSSFSPLSHFFSAREGTTERDTTRILVFCMSKIWLVAWAYPCYKPQKCQLHALPLQQLPLQQPPLQLLNFQLVACVTHAITSGILVATVRPCNKYPCYKSDAESCCNDIALSSGNDIALNSCMGKVCGSHRVVATIED